MAGCYKRASPKLAAVTMFLLAISVTINIKNADFYLSRFTGSLRRAPSPPPDLSKLRELFKLVQQNTTTSHDSDELGWMTEDGSLWRKSTTDYDDTEENDDDFGNDFDVTGKDEDYQYNKEEADRMTEFQRSQSERLRQLRQACHALHPSEQDVTSPSFNNASILKTFDRVFVIHKYKLVYFFIPKVSTTSWKRLLLVLHGYEIFRNPTQEKYDVHTFAGRVFERLSNIPIERAKIILREYRSFVFVRNPYSRLLSAYQSKILNPGKHERYRKSMILKWLQTHPFHQDSSHDPRRDSSYQHLNFNPVRHQYEEDHHPRPRRTPYDQEFNSNPVRNPFEREQYPRPRRYPHDENFNSNPRRLSQNVNSKYNQMRYMGYDVISQVSFPQFVHFYLSTNSKSSDIHWRDMYHISHPCMVQFSFIGHYETLKSDSDYILDLVEAPSDIRFPSQKQTSTTGSSSQDTMMKYYGQLSDSQLRELSTSPSFKRDLQLFGYEMPSYIRRSTT